MANEPLLVTVPKENVNDETVRLAAWRAAEGSRVSQGAVVAEIETSKAVIEVLSPAAGHVRHAASEGATLAVGGPLFFLTAGPDDPLPIKTGPAKEAAGAPVEGRFSRKALALLASHGIDKASFSGQGLVRESDVIALLRKQGKAPACSGTTMQTHLKGLSVRKEGLSLHKRAEVQSLSQGQNAGLSSLVSLPCPLAGFKKAVEKHRELAATPLALIVSAAGRLLRKHPVFNSFYEDGAVCGYDEVHVGFVIDADRGLKVPVVRDADKHPLGDVARRMQDLMLAYEEGSLPAEALANGTFTVTDLSAEGAVFFHPLINERQAAILGIAAPRGETFDLILAFDHRITEGRAAARFLRELRELLTESP